ncbi:MAG: hypothetical protein Q8S19_06330 [Bacillota bacterium]|nr:hypothetical protein [Bacillota bacterium]
MTVVHKAFGTGKVAAIQIEGAKHFIEVQFAGERRKLEWELCLGQGFINIR